MSIGAAISGIGSIVNAYTTMKANNKALAQKQKNIDDGKKIVSEGYDEVDDYLDAYKKTLDGRKVTTDADRQKYAQLVTGYDPEDYIAERGSFDKSQYDVDDYINENRDAILKSAAEAVQRTAAGAGIGRGTGAATDIAQAVVDKDENLTDKAYDRMMDDRNFDYTEFQNKYNANQAALDKLSQGIQTQVSMLGGAIQQEDQAEDDYLSDVIAAKTGRTNATVSLLT